MIIFAVISLIFCILSVVQCIEESRSSSVRSDLIGGQWIERKWVYLRFSVVFFALFTASSVLYLKS